MIIDRLICIRGPRMRPSATACLMPRSAPPASFTAAEPKRSIIQLAILWIEMNAEVDGQAVADVVAAHLPEPAAT